MIPEKVQKIYYVKLNNERNEITGGLQQANPQLWLMQT